MGYQTTSTVDEANKQLGHCVGLIDNWDSGLGYRITGIVGKATRQAGTVVGLIERLGQWTASVKELTVGGPLILTRKVGGAS